MNKKLIIISIILIILLNTILSSVAKASEIITKANLINDHKIDTHMLYYNNEREEWRDIQCGYICYKLEEEKFPAYCITPNTNGVDEEGPYTVTINKLLNDKLIYNILINGYPYKTPSQLGVETSDDAYVATKLALKNALLDRDVTGFYKPADPRGEKIMTAMFNIIENGKKGNETNKKATILVNKIGNLIESGNYYYQEYKVTADVNISKYMIDSITDFPEGTYIADKNNINKNSFLAEEEFKIMIPKSEINKDISGKINITALCNTKPIFYGEAPNSKIQDYAITYKPYIDYSTSAELNKSTNTCSIKIIKKDNENLEPIQDVEFGLYNENNEYITSQTTNKEGIALFSNLYQGKYKIKEIETNVDYIKDETIYEILTQYNEEEVKTVTNAHKKGNLKIIKVDKDDKTTTLGSIEFDLIDKNGKVIRHLATDVNGEVDINNINVGKYILRETKTKREYNLCEDTEVFVEWNKTNEIIIENEKKKGQIKIVKQDLEKEDIKLHNVIFQIIDKNNKIIEEIQTNNNGEATSSRLLVGEYKLREIKSDSNQDYVVNNRDYIVQVENNKISEIIIKNEHKKGNLKIKKVDKDNPNIGIEGVEFEIVDKDGFIYETVTNEKGIAEVKNIRIGEIKIKEIKTNKQYTLSKNIVKTEIKFNENTEIIIENEKKKGQVEIYKIDEENHNIKIPNVEFEILDTNRNVVDKIITNEKGYGISKKLPMGEYYLKEVKTNKNYVLNDQIIKFSIEENEITKLNIKNQKIKGKIQIIKTSSNDSPILNIKRGEYISGVEFQIYNSKNELVDTLITDKEGKATSKDLVFGRYKVIEKNTNKYYILNTNEYFINIENDNEIIVLNIENEAIVPRIEIEKKGEEFAEKNEEIKYEFDIKNMSNSKLDNFTWIENIPYSECNLTNMVTGIYNENIDYEIYYKTNKSEYKLLKKANTFVNEYIDFDDLNLNKGEVVTEIKVEYKTVSKDFRAIVKPCIFTKIKSNLKNGDKIINVTELYGQVDEYEVRDKSSFETIIKEKEILKKLPKTGC